MIPVVSRICSLSLACFRGTTRCLSRPDFLLGEVRRLTALYMAGGATAFDGFLDLVSLLLNLTILAPGGAVLAESERFFLDIAHRPLSGPAM